MIIGVPKEMREDEARVPIEPGAGEGSGRRGPRKSRRCPHG